MADQEKDKRIKKEKNRLKKIFSEISESKRKLAEPLIENAAFMRITLEDLQQQVNDEGAVIEAVNGNGFKTQQEHPAQKSYNVMMNRYSATIKQLTDLLPDAKTETTSKAGEALAAFVMKGKPKRV